MKKVFGWILGILLSPVLLFIILTVLLYLPPVQNWAVDKVAAVASEKTGWDISVGHVNLSFPLDLAIDDFRVIAPPDSLTARRDTIADVRRLVVDVQLLPLLHQRVVINQLEVSDTRLDTDGLVDAAHVKGNFGRLFLTSKGIDLDRQTVELNGARLEDARFDVVLRDSVPEDTTTTETLWKIHADSLLVLRSDVALHMPGDTMSVQAHLGQLAAREALIDLGTETYTVGSVDLTHGALKYDQNFEPPVADGIDFNHLDLTNLTLGIDSIYYHDPTLHLNVRNLAFKEKSGLQVTDLSGPVTMENGTVRLPRFRLKTAESDIYVELDMPLSLTDPVDPGKLRLRLDAQLGRSDLMPFMSALPQSVRDRWPRYPLSVKGVARGNMDYMEFDDLDVDLPTAFHATATGFVANLNDMDRLRADVQFKARTQDLGFLMAALPRDVQRNYRIPNGLTAEGRVKADGANYTADVTAREGRGMLKLNGTLNADVMRYDAKISVRDLNLHHFMPHDSLYTLTADATVRGQGTDIFSPRTTLIADATVQHFRYGSYNLENITAQANVQNGHVTADIVSRNPLVDGIISLTALMSKDKVDATIGADITRADLRGLQVVDQPLTIGLCGHIDVTSDLKLTHHVIGLVNDVTLNDSLKTYRPGDVSLLLNARTNTTYARLQSGDLTARFYASGDYEHLIQQFTTLADTIQAQFDQRIIDQSALRRLLPTMKLHVESKNENPVASLLKRGQNLDFRALLFDLDLSPETGVNGNGYIHSLTMSDVRLDTVKFRLTQRLERLSFGGQIRNNKRNPQFVFNALFDGVLQERGATFGVRYYDSANKLGARIGAQLEMADSGYHVRLVPERPTLGYKEFQLNKDNYIFLAASGRVLANVNLLADDGTAVSVYSEDTDPTALQDLTVSLEKFNLAEITSVLPYVPRMAGILDGDNHVMQDADGHFSMVSDMSVRGMAYEGSPIGNVSTELIYLQKENDAHAVEARLLKDDKEIGLLTGTYYNEGDGSLDTKVQLTHLPLSLANGFVPDQLLGLEGYGDGEMTIVGPLSKPVVNGRVLLDSAYVVSMPYGIRLRAQDEPVRITNSDLKLDNFTLYSGDNSLNVMGDINFADLDRIMVNMRVRANNFQVINAKEHANSVAFGKAFVDIYARMRGPLDDLNMRGVINVLGTTDMSYVLRDTPLTTDNQLEELVKFTDFSDTTQVAVVERPALTGFKMDMTVNVSTGAHIMAYLNADHSNYVDLLGGGNLHLLYSPSDDLQLTGRYTLSNGEMKYSLPIIPLKTFTIQDGSYIEFTGAPMNPTLNITATEQVKATVATDGGAGHSVNFNCGVVITRTLSDMGLEFTLDAPEDMQLHSELQAMSLEERGKLAVTMLTTGMYLAGGSTGSFSMNSALSSFLNSEISQITGNALRTLDLSFGMDNTTDATGNTHTDYSFKFAKRFWNNRMRIVVGGKVSSGSDATQNRSNSFFDNVSLEYRLSESGNKYVTLFYENNAYDWLDGYTQKYGGGFTWRRSLQKFTDLFRFKETTTMPVPARQPQRPDSLRTDSVRVNR